MKNTLLKNHCRERCTKIFLAFVLVIGASLQTKAQSWNINGNANISSGNNYLGTSDPNDLVFRTNALERGRLLGSEGLWRFGAGNDYTQIDSLGKLTFSGKGVLRIAGNRYVFQYKSDGDYGLFFNSNDMRYEFRNDNADPVFYINGSNGSLSIGNSTTGLNYILPPARGANKQVLKTDGAGNVQWADDNVADPNTVWKINGNSGTTPGPNFIGTTDSAAFAIKTNNTARLRVSAEGFVGIGTTTPQARLHLNGGTNVALNNGGTLVIGAVDDNNLAVDNNDIQARNNGGRATLNLNKLGGLTTVGGDLDVSGDIIGGNYIFFGSQYIHDAGTFRIGVNGSIESSFDGADPLGSSSKRWSEVWAVDGTINTSDLRDKTNVRDLNYGLKEIMKLRSVKFNWKQAASKEDKVGLIAQELLKVMPEVVRDYEYRRDEQGNRQKVPAARLGVMYDDLIPVLIKAVQEQQLEIEALRKYVNNSDENVSSTPADNAVQSNATSIKLSSTVLEQNTPNPVKNTTAIRYNISPNAKNASLVITDVNGKTIKQVNVKPGNGVVNVDASALNAGIFNYTLIVDGAKLESKRMIISR